MREAGARRQLALNEKWRHLGPVRYRISDKLRPEWKIVNKNFVEHMPGFILDS